MALPGWTDDGWAGTARRPGRELHRPVGAGRNARGHDCQPRADLGLLLPAPPVPFRAGWTVDCRHGVAAVNDRGNGNWRLAGQWRRDAARRAGPRLDIALAASRLTWTLAARSLGAGTTIAGIDVPIGIDVSAEAAPLAGGTLEQVRASVRSSRSQGPVVREARASAAGQRDAATERRYRARRSGASALRGRRAARGACAADHGAVDRRGVRDGWPAAWLARTAGECGAPRQVVRACGSQRRRCRAAASRRHLDDAAISGGLRLKRGDPPSLTVDLTADRLALDPWLPSRPATLAELYKAASGLDVDLRLNIRQALLAGVTIDGLGGRCRG